MLCSVVRASDSQKGSHITVPFTRRIQQGHGKFQEVGQPLLCECEAWELGDGELWNQTVEPGVLANFMST